MTPRDTFADIMYRRPCERMLVWHWPFGTYGGGGTQFWTETINRWHMEGLPEAVDSPSRVNEFFAVDKYLMLPVNPLLCPAFGERTLEETDSYTIRIDADGVTERVFRGEAAGSSMPQFLSYPMETHDDWQRMRERLQPDCPGRIPRDFPAAVAALGSTGFPVGIYVGSLFGILRNWMGLEGISYAICDDPAWVLEMMEHLSDLTIEVYRRALTGIETRLDFALFWEDMAYRNGPLISPCCFKRLMMPSYRRVVDFVRNHLGIDVVMVDCDGNIDQLIPLWLGVGVNCMLPLEAAAGMDPVRLRKGYGDDLLMIGGLDKRCLAAGRRAIREELAYKLSIVQRGGFIPAVDHAVPPDVSFADYMCFHNILRASVSGAKRPACGDMDLKETVT